MKLRTISHKGKLIEKMRSMRGEKEEPSAIHIRPNLEIYFQIEENFACGKMLRFVFLKLRTILHMGKILEKMRSMRGEKEEPSAIGFT